jgi:hypothetical protein
LSQSYHIQYERTANIAITNAASQQHNQHNHQNYGAMSQKLKPLLLPQLVEERRKRESMQSENEMDISSSFYYTYNSSSSDIPSPTTPTFSTRGHLRYASSTSSMDLSANTTPATDSPSSPTFMNTQKSAKRALPDVQEEPQERDEDFDMFEDTDELYDCFCKFDPGI